MFGTARKAKLKNKKKKSGPVFNVLGWNTTDTDEIERRRVRAQTEKFKCKQLEPEFPYFGTFLVVSFKKQDSQYQVEIRSLIDHINSCDCPDYRGNGLGTCKHIEHVLFSLQKKQKKKFKQAASEGSSRIEIFIDRRTVPTLSILKPKKSIFPSMERQLEPFFTSGDVLKGELTVAYPKLKQIVEAIPKKLLKNKIRFSCHMEDIVEIKERHLQKHAGKEKFLLKSSKEIQAMSTLKFPLYSYQEEGMLHLALTERALLADEMGLGKTVQAIAACQLLHRMVGIKKVLVVATASLKAEWLDQIAKFTNFKSLVIQGTRANRLEQYKVPSFFYLTNYEQILMDGPEIQRLISPDIIILDEAQRIKNWHTKTAGAVKMLKSRYAFVLTGTPLENRIDDIYSVVQFLDPHFFGPLFRFNREFYQLDENGRPIGYKNLDELHRRLRYIMLRRRKHEVEGQLPERINNNYFVNMEAEQRRRYEEYEGLVARLAATAKRRALRKEEHEKLQKWLACMRMLCDTPYILDPKCRICPKLSELESILEEVLQDETAKIIIFSEWERMLQLVRQLAQKMDINYAWHTGSVLQHKRRQEINRFKELPSCRLFLSTDAGSLGLNLQMANVVINLDLPWNPAKLEQRIARAWRKHQIRIVRVINFVCQDSIEHRMLTLLSQKQTLAQGVLEGTDDLKTMDLPSSRDSFMKRLETILSPVEYHPVEEIPPVESDLTEAGPTDFNQAKTDTVESSKPSKVIEFEIKSIAEPNIQLSNLKSPMDDMEIMDKLVQETAVTANVRTLQNRPVKIVDPKTFKVIQALANAGILMLNPEITLLPEMSNEFNTRGYTKKQIQQAKSTLSLVLRKERLAQVLIEQGFLEESLAELMNMLEFSIYAFSCLGTQKEISKEEAISWGFIEEHLEPRGLPRKAYLLLEKLRKMQGEKFDNLSVNQIKLLLVDCQSVFHFINDFFEQECLCDSAMPTTVL